MTVTSDPVSTVKRRVIESSCGHRASRQTPQTFGGSDISQFIAMARGLLMGSAGSDCIPPWCSLLLLGRLVFVEVGPEM